MATASRTLVERYALPPADIEALGLRRASAALGGLERWSEEERQVVQRIIYASGDPALAPLVGFHPQAVKAGTDAFKRGRPIVVDARMVEAALDRRLASKLNCSVHCAIDTPAVSDAARMAGLPRAVVAMRSLVGLMVDGVVIVGNAPTALLSLLDLVDAGQATPALIIGMPVGFVAATEAKAELARRAVPFITIEGTRGGSALAAAAANALLRMAAAGR